jgi:hypothetical protein
MTPGVHRGMSNAAYQASDALSVSQVKRLRRSPFHYRALLSPTAPQKAPTPQMLNGTLTHCALLEPDAFPLRYVVGPDLNKNSNAWRAFIAEHAAFEVIDQQAKDRAHAQADALRALPEVAELMAHGEAEVSAFWHEEVGGVPVLCRCRPDWVSHKPGALGCVLLDVKTTTDASPEGFARACNTFDYHLQADWYCRGYELASGLRVHGMVFVVVESEFPFAAAAYMLSDRALELAHQQNRDALRTFARCQAAQSWPGYAQGIRVIDLPQWAYQ